VRLVVVDHDYPGRHFTLLLVTTPELESTGP
jgi:hypothetical protein